MYFLRTAALLEAPMVPLQQLPLVFQTLASYREDCMYFGQVVHGRIPQVLRVDMGAVDHRKHFSSDEIQS